MSRWVFAFKYLFREIIIYNLIFTGISVQLILTWGPKSFIYVFWVKLAGYVFTFIAYYWNRRKYLYFFHNLGLTSRNLVVSTVGVDTVISLIIFFITHIIR